MGSVVVYPARVYSACCVGEGEWRRGNECVGWKVVVPAFWHASYTWDMRNGVCGVFCANVSFQLHVCVLLFKCVIPAACMYSVINSFVIRAPWCAPTAWHPRLDECQGLSPLVADCEQMTDFVVLRRIMALA